MSSLSIEYCLCYPTLQSGKGFASLFLPLEMATGNYYDIDISCSKALPLMYCKQWYINDTHLNWHSVPVYKLWSQTVSHCDELNVTVLPCDVLNITGSWYRSISIKFQSFFPPSCMGKYKINRGLELYFWLNCSQSENLHIEWRMYD